MERYRSGKAFEVSVAWKKRVLGDISVADARDAIRKILAITEDDLSDSNKVTELPYPGLGRACKRPPPRLEFVGKEHVQELVFRWCEGYRDFVITGPKGVGKSTDFRALAVILTKAFAQETEPPKSRLIFLYAELLSLDIVGTVKNALLFSFLVDEVTKYGEWKQAQVEIDAIDSLDAAVAFIQQRKKPPALETFYFFVDGGEQLDPKDFCGVEHMRATQRIEVAVRLETLLSTGTRVWWCTSPRAESVQAGESTLTKFTYVRRGFNEEQFRTYFLNSFLNTIHQSRASTIEYLTGYVPLFLEVLRECCEQVAERHLESEKQALRSASISLKMKTLADLSLTSEQIAATLQEDDDWNSAVLAFQNHDELKLVRNKARTINLQDVCNTDAEMAALDPSYVLEAADGVYCSSYIRRIYTQEILAKEQKLKLHADGAWLQYARRLLQKDGVDWSMLGHLCEDVMADVIQKKGLKVGQLKVRGETLTIQKFDVIPSLDIAQLKPNSGYYYQPVRLNFEPVDGVIVWVDEKGKLFIIALQFTVHIDKSLHSAAGFMNFVNLRKWFPHYTDGSAADLHYVFIGCSSYCSSVVAPATCPSGTVAGYTMHSQPFDSEAFPGLHDSDYKALYEMTAKRTWKTTYAHVRPDGLALKALTRAELEKLAREKFGIPRKLFKNKGILINTIMEQQT